MNLEIPNLKSRVAGTVLRQNVAAQRRVASDDAQQIPKNNDLSSSKLERLKRKFVKISKNRRLVGFLIFLVLLIIVGLIGIVVPGTALVNQVKNLETKAQKIKSTMATKDLKLIKREMEEVGQEVEKLEKGYKRLFLLKIIPGLRGYYLDGQGVIKAAKAGVKTGKIIIEAVEPYQDFLGLIGDEEEGALAGGEKTTEERISFLVESIEGLRPRLNEIEKELKIIEESVSRIDPQKYPERIKGREIRNKVSQGKRLIGQIRQAVSEGRPLLERADWLLGKDDPRKYLFLFQNDAELRPTGGFWTAYGIIEVDNGKFSPSVSEDIYALDARFMSNILAPRPIEKYHKNVHYWYLRDMNLSPDFKTSVEEFIKHYKEIKGAKEFEGVIAVDTQVLVDILEVLGRIGVPGWGNFTPEPDDRCWGCPQVVYQLELLADKPLSTIKADRKGFLAPLMHSIIANALGSPKEKVSDLANAVLKSFKEKNILVYFPDEDLQKAVEGLNVAGAVESAGEDYFHLNDANFAGAKSNLFISQEVKQEYKVEKDGRVIKKATVVYKNTAPPSNCNLERGDLCLNGLYRNWFRFYVPQGSKLIKMTGSEVEPEVYDELGKTVLEGFYGNKYPLHPQGSARVTVEYELPFKPAKTIKLLIQKQPGTKSPKYEILVNGSKQREFNLSADRNLDLSL